MSLDLLSTPWLLLLVGLAAVALLTLFVGVAILAKDSRSPLAWGVGATAGLQTAQVASIHAFCFAVAAWVLLGVAKHRRGQGRVGRPLVILLAAGMLASTAWTGVMVNNQLTAIQLMILASAAACVACFADRYDIFAALRGLLAITTLSCLVAILQYVHVLHYAVFLGTRRPIGIYSEPDWMGMFALIGLVIVFRLGRGWWRIPLVLLHVVALMLSAARAAWLALGVVLVLGWLAVKISKRAERIERFPRGRWTVVVAAVVVAITVAASPSLRESVQSRLETASVDRPDAGAMARLQQNNSLLKLESQSPWYGLGLTASGRVGVSGQITTIGTANNNVASNWVLGWWVDGGVFALGIILIFFWAAFSRLCSTSGMLLTVVLVSSFFSSAMLIPISWFLLGICMAEAGQTAKYGSVSRRCPPRSNGVAAVPDAARVLRS